MFTRKFTKKYLRKYLRQGFGADISDMKFFRALKMKLSRDYIQFFNNLNKAYTKGPYKKLASESITLISQTIVLLEHIIGMGVIDKEKVNEIIENVEQLNARRDIIVEKSLEVKALKNRLESIQKTTGITPEALNITKEIIRKGAREEVRKKRKGVVPFLRRGMPRTAALTAEMGKGLAAGFLGPFYPIASILGVPAKEPFYPIASILGVPAKELLGLVGRSLTQRRERKLTEKLLPLSWGLPAEEIRRIYRARQVGPPLSSMVRRVAPPLGSTFQRVGPPLGSTGRRVEKRAWVSVLVDFFNRGAYKAKWTKELLKRIKGVKKGGLAGLLGATGLTAVLAALKLKFLSLGKAMIPLLGNAGKFALLVGAIAFAANRLKELFGKFGEYQRVKQAVEAEIEKQKKLQAKYKEQLQTALEEKYQKGLRGDKAE